MEKQNSCSRLLIPTYEQGFDDGDNERHLYLMTGQELVGFSYRALNFFLDKTT